MTTVKKKETYYLRSIFCFCHYFDIWFYLQMQPAQGNLCSKYYWSKTKIEIFLKKQPFFKH